MRKKKVLSRELPHHAVCYLVMNLLSQEGPAPMLCLGFPQEAYRIAIANKGPYFQVLAQDLVATSTHTVG